MLSKLKNKHNLTGGVANDGGDEGRAQLGQTATCRNGCGSHETSGE